MRACLQSILDGVPGLTRNPRNTVQASASRRGDKVRRRLDTHHAVLTVDHQTLKARTPQYQGNRGVFERNKNGRHWLASQALSQTVFSHVLANTTVAGVR